MPLESKNYFLYRAMIGMCIKSVKACSNNTTVDFGYEWKAAETTSLHPSFISPSLRWIT